MTITLILMIATLLAMVVGLVFMAIGGKLNRKYSNKLMSLRVLMQALAIASIGLLYIFSKH
jgi:hypothetical protein